MKRRNRWPVGGPDSPAAMVLEEREGGETVYGYAPLPASDSPAWIPIGLDAAKVAPLGCERTFAGKTGVVVAVSVASTGGKVKLL